MKEKRKEDKNKSKGKENERKKKVKRMKVVNEKRENVGLGNKERVEVLSGRKED